MSASKSAAYSTIIWETHEYNQVRCLRNGRDRSPREHVLSSKTKLSTPITGSKSARCSSSKVFVGSNYHSLRLTPTNKSFDGGSRRRETYQHSLCQKQHKTCQPDSLFSIARLSTNRIICTGAVNGSDTERIDDHTSFVHGFVRAAEIASNTQWKSEDGNGKSEQPQEMFPDSHGRPRCRFLSQG